MPDLLQTITDTIAQAITRLGEKQPVASPLRSLEWEKIPLALRERAQFSAGIEELHTLQSITDKLDEWADFIHRDPQGAFMDRSKFVAEMRAEMGAPEGDTGKLTDIASRRRLELIYNFQTTDATEYARFTVGQDSSLLEAFPCQEFLRVEDRKVPRDWIRRWVDAGGSLYDGRMIASKDDPIWTAISRFGRPWPPFDYGSGMGLEDVGRQDAIDLGVIKSKDKIEPTLESFNAGLQASVADLSPALQHRLKAAFGKQIKIKNGVASWAQ